MPSKLSFGILVLGDVGRSPRMQYHAVSLARKGYPVTVFGVSGAQPVDDFVKNDNISVVYLHNPPRILYGAITFYEKNPPAVPSLPCAWLVCRLKRASFLVDWHNYGYSIMGLNTGPRHPLVRLYRQLERSFGARADGGFCVTEAMREDLGINWHISAVRLLDRPPARFRILSVPEQHDLLLRLSREFPQFSDFRGGDDKSESTAFTFCENSAVDLRPNRPALLVSSTSWTADEDFSLLFSALDKYDVAVSTEKSQNLPRLVCVVTGRGPQKPHYEQLIRERQWRNVQVVLPWLSAEDYPKLLACADLGVCLHTSSSGLDLPMKVVDMFGAGVPALAFDYRCIEELVTPGVTGELFSDRKQLLGHLKRLLRDFPPSVGVRSDLGVLREGVAEFGRRRWDDEWSERAWPYLESLMR